MAGYFTTVTLRTERTKGSSGGMVLYVLTSTWFGQRGLRHHLELVDLPPQERTTEWYSDLPPVFTALDVIQGHNQALGQADVVLGEQMTRILQARIQEEARR